MKMIMHNEKQAKVRSSAFGGQLSAEDDVSGAKQAEKRPTVACMPIDRPQEIAFADSLLLKAEGLQEMKGLDS